MSSEAADPLSALTAAGLFALLWDSMADLLGTAATAALLRRALRRAAARQPVLSAAQQSVNGNDTLYRPPTHGSPSLQKLSQALHNRRVLPAAKIVCQ